MKIRYEFVNGEIVEVEVEDGLGALLLEFDRLERNNNQTETRRHASLSGMDYEGAFFDAGVDVDQEVRRRLSCTELHHALQMLSPSQKKLVQKVFFMDQRLVELARTEGVSEAAIRNRLKKIYAKLKKYLI